MTATTTTGVQGPTMLRKRPCLWALAVSLALILGGVPNIARASTVVQATMTIRGDYACVGPCATATYFSGVGIAHSEAQGFGTMIFSETGTATGVDAAGCGISSISYSLTTLGGIVVAVPLLHRPGSSATAALTTQMGKNSIFFSTVDDTECPTADPNVFRDTATLTVTGGTGIFSSAAGAGTITWSVLGYPQTATGMITFTITY